MSAPAAVIHPGTLENLATIGAPETPTASLRAVTVEHGLVLTDDFNPVEFRDAANREQIRKFLVMGMQ